MFFVLDENHNLVEAYDKEGVLAVLAQAIADGSLSGISEDAGFVSKLKCCVTGGTTQVAFVTQAKYNELKATDSIDSTCLYYITDDTTAEDINTLLTRLTNTVNGMLDGTQPVGKVDPSQIPLTLNFVPEFNKSYAQLKAEYEANKAETDETKKDAVYKTEAQYSIWHGHWSKQPEVGELFTATGKSKDGYVFGFKGRVVKAGSAVFFAFDDLVLYHDASIDVDVATLKNARKLLFKTGVIGENTHSYDNKTYDIYTSSDETNGLLGKVLEITINYAGGDGTKSAGVYRVQFDKATVSMGVQLSNNIYCKGTAGVYEQNTSISILTLTVSLKNAKTLQIKGGASKFTFGGLNIAEVQTHESGAPWYPAQYSDKVTSYYCVESIHEILG
jgi:hypothetical protein